MGKDRLNVTYTHKPSHKPYRNEYIIIYRIAMKKLNTYKHTHTHTNTNTHIDSLSVL